MYGSFYCHFLGAHKCLIIWNLFPFSFPQGKKIVHNVIRLLLESVTNYRQVVSCCREDTFCTFIFKADICKIKLASI